MTEGAEVAIELFGAEAVQMALEHPDPEPITVALAQDIRTRAASPGVFRAWALAQSWPRFCTIVRVITGSTREELLSGEG